MPRRTRIVAAAVIVVIVVALIIGWRVTRPHEAVAADGRQVAIEQVTYGTEHRLTLGKLWVRVLKPLLGTRWAARRGCFEARLASTNPVLVVWTRWSGISKTNALPVEATIINENGIESELIVSRWNQSDWWAHTNRFESTSYVAWLLQNYPRRQRDLRLRIYDRDPSWRLVPVAELPFANSGRTSFPQWEGEALPISRTNGAVTFTLNRIESATGALCHARFEIRTNGVPDFSWQIGSIQARDATGNAFWGRSNVFTGLSTNRTFSVPGTLWPDERAWKLSVEFCRGTNFASNELWTTPAMTIQPFGKQLALGITNSMLNGPTVIVTSPQMTSTIPTHLRAVRPIAQVRAWLGPHFCHRRLFLVGVTDNQGRELECEPSGRPSIDGWQNFIFGVPKGAQTVRLTFAVRESEVIEFNFSAKSLVQNNEALH